MLESLEVLLVISRLNKKRKKLTKISRLKRKIFAEWEQQDLYDPNIMNKINDAMLNQTPIQINYENSGYRECIPYSWYTSKDGNVMIQCYRTDTNELRRYRFDRIDELYLNTDFENGYDETQQGYNNENWNAEEVGNNMEEIFDQNSEDQSIDMTDYEYEDEDLNGEEQNEEQPEQEIYDENVFSLENQDQESEEENYDNLQF